jgi:hypothetical protein
MNHRPEDRPEKSASLPHLAPPDYCDPVIEFYKKDVDRTLLLENLKLTVQEWFEKFQRLMELVDGLHQAGQAARDQDC